VTGPDTSSFLISPVYSFLFSIRSSTYTRDGCNGGFTATAFDYVKNAGGITFEDFYPYNISTATTCDKAKKDYTVTVTNWHRLADEQAMIDYVLAKGTLSVVVDATLWGTYQSGIFTNCGSTLSINHAVNIVGVNVDEGYWIIRNSWSTWWGDKGYMKLALVRIHASISSNLYLVPP
jgi:C1A family cysteine protease